VLLHSRPNHAGATRLLCISRPVVPIQFEGRTLCDGFLTAPVPVEGALRLERMLSLRSISRQEIWKIRARLPTSSAAPSTIIARHGDIAWRQQADIIIEPDVKSFVWDDFTRTNDLIAVGEAATQAALPEIKALLSGEKRDSPAVKEA